MLDKNTVQFAQLMDHSDPLAAFRSKFYIPKRKNGQNELYFCGHSLGLQSISTSTYIQDELDKWQRLGVKGHFQGKYPWRPYHEYLSDPLATLVGAKATEVVAMNSLTVNLHLMLATFYHPSTQRYKMLIEGKSFPSDHYALSSQIKYHHLNPDDALLLMNPREYEDVLRHEDILALIDRHSNSLSVILLPGVQYYTGQILKMAEITEFAHQHNIIVGIDLAHAIGNIPLQLHDWDIDFAVWCNYKYLNSGPGAVGACYLHERHATNRDLPRFAGWWGHDKATRFKMETTFNAIPTAEGWQLSNAPILSLAALRASLDLFRQAGGMQPLREKSIQLTGYLEYLLKRECEDAIRIITPHNPDERGCQLSLEIAMETVDGKDVYRTLIAMGVTVDWREPNIIRIAPVPLYNSFEDIYLFVQSLSTLIGKKVG